MVHSLQVLQVTLLFLLSAYSFDLGGHEGWEWPGSHFDGIALGYGFPGWELPLPPPPLPLPVVHNHFHNYPPHDHEPHHHHYDHEPHHHHYGHGPYGPPHDFPVFGGGYGYGLGYGQGYGPPHSPYRDYFCHHARKMRHLKKWLLKMMSCSLF